jgi:proteasome lid subunit RPN8/RPN11
MNLVIPLDAWRLLEAHLEAAYPNEGAGLLLGHANGQGMQIELVLPLENRWQGEEQYHRFVLRPQDFVFGEAEAEKRGLQLLGCFHSHPDHPAEPSEFDRDAAWPNFTYIITTVAQGRVTRSRSWRLKEDRSGYTEEKLLISEG